MSVKISGVVHGSVAEKKGIRAENTLVSINGNPIDDVLDYRFYAETDKLKIEYVNSRGHLKHIKLKNISSCDELGLEFETYLMDKHRSCKNHCIFCFIDQLPRGLRNSLYFKDDDSRLSFLFGNYITLTNLTEHDVERIIKMHISPLNASIHTMNADLRVKMMRNPKAGESLSLLKRFSDAGIKINTQLVLCPGINDGAELEFSLDKLSEISGVESIAAVPVGLTKYRDGLYPLREFTPAEAAAVIDMIDAFNEKLNECGRKKTAFPSDEFFQIAGRTMPGEEYYADFPQLDNGVGLCTLTEMSFSDKLASTESDTRERNFTVATGSAAYPLISGLAEKFTRKFPASKIDVYEIKNKFFGENVTVAGLVTGHDLTEQLKECDFRGKKLLIPSVMIKSRDERIFLDDVSVVDVEKALDTEVFIGSPDCMNLFDDFFGM